MLERAQERAGRKAARRRNVRRRRRAWRFRSRTQRSTGRRWVSACETSSTSIAVLREILRVLQPGRTVCQPRRQQSAKPSLEAAVRRLLLRHRAGGRRLVGGSRRAYSYLPNSLDAPSQRRRTCATLRARRIRRRPVTLRSWAARSRSTSEANRAHVERPSTTRLCGATCRSSSSPRRSRPIIR